MTYECVSVKRNIILSVRSCVSRARYPKSRLHMLTVTNPLWWRETTRNAAIHSHIFTCMPSRMERSPNNNKKIIQSSESRKTRTWRLWCARQAQRSARSAHTRSVDEVNVADGETSEAKKERRIADACNTLNSEKNGSRLHTKPQIEDLYFIWHREMHKNRICR